MSLKGKIKLPATRKGRIWASVGTGVAVVSLFGAIGDATQPASDKQYKMCMEAYHDAKHCYEDVYGRHTQPTPVDNPTTPGDVPVNVPAPTDWNPFPAPAAPKHFHFNPDVRLDVTEVIDLR